MSQQTLKLKLLDLYTPDKSSKSRIAGMLSPLGSFRHSLSPLSPKREVTSLTVKKPVPVAMGVDKPYTDYQPILSSLHKKQRNPSDSSKESEVGSKKIKKQTFVESRQMLKPSHTAPMNNKF